MEVAEEALLAFYEARDAVLDAFVVISRSYDLAARELQPNKSEKDAALVSMFCASTDRLKENSQKFSRLYMADQKFRAYFGEERCGPLRVVKDAHHRIRNYTAYLLNGPFEEGDTEKDARRARNWKQVVTSALRDVDAIPHDLDAATEELEEICRPILAGGREWKWKGMLSRFRL